MKNWHYPTCKYTLHIYRRLSPHRVIERYQKARLPNRVTQAPVTPSIWFGLLVGSWQALTTASHEIIVGLQSAMMLGYDLVNVVQGQTRIVTGTKSSTRNCFAFNFKPWLNSTLARAGENVNEEVVIEVCGCQFGSE